MRGDYTDHDMNDCKQERDEANDRLMYAQTALDTLSENYGIALYQIARAIAQLEHRHPPQLEVIVASVIAQLRAYEASIE